jgi:phenylpropionate dioxygenase-like ring-hydroxylating dioxygenase large terminal subunit
VCGGSGSGGSGSGSGSGGGAAVASFPTRVTGDVLWAFFDRADPRFAAQLGAEALPFNAFPESRFPLLKGALATYTRELPYSFDFLVENFMDPGHIPFAHHGLQVSVGCWLLL